MTETRPTQSEFVQHAMDALGRYDRLRAGGMSHRMALHASGFYDVIVKPDTDTKPDYRAQAARNDA